MIARFATLVLLLAAGCGDPVVGATCREGFAESDGRCVPDSTDSGTADGATGDAGDRDAAMPDDGGSMDADVGDGSMGDGSMGDAGMGDAGTPLCDLGEILCGPDCVRPASDPMHCGGCGMACAMGELCAAGRCRMRCAAPLMSCGGRCIDVNGNDPDNCGSCGNRCPSGICLAGTCVAAMAGHVVVVGHDYQSGRPGMRRVAGNSVFLAPGAPVNVLVYEGDAENVSIRGVDRAIDQVARERGRSWTRIVATPSQFLLQLDLVDALVIYPQRATPDAMLTTLGTSWSVGLATFLRRGGVVVVFDGPGPNGGTYQILQAAGLFSATSRTEVTGDNLSVVSAGDAVALSVPLSYMAEMSSVRFDTMDTTVVVQHAMGPVVVHRVITP